MPRQTSGKTVGIWSCCTHEVSHDRLIQRVGLCTEIRFSSQVGQDEEILQAHLPHHTGKMSPRNCELKRNWHGSAGNSVWWTKRFQKKRTSLPPGSTAMGPHGSLLNEKRPGIPTRLFSGSF